MSDRLRLPAETLKEWALYEPETGLFRWLQKPNNRVRIGGIAGSADPRGYIDLQVCGHRGYAHQLAFLYMTGAWPGDEIDHRNGIKSDNRWCNLREASRTLNQQNQRRAQSNSTTGLLGVLVAGPGRFCARIRVGGRNRHLGSFGSPEEAHAVYLAANRKLHEGCTL